MLKGIVKNNRFLSVLFYAIKPGNDFAAFVDYHKKYRTDNASKVQKVYGTYKYLNNKYGFSMKQFFLYRLYDLPEKIADSFISERRRAELFDFADDKRYLHIMSNKKDFYSVYKRFMSNDTFFVEGPSDKQKFFEFCEGKNCAIIKPVLGQKGIGVQKVSLIDTEAKNSAWKLLAGGDYLADGVLLNCQEIAVFHPESLNTVRVATVLDSDGRVRIMAASLRLGVGLDCTDNASRGGIFCSIDTKTGVINSDGVNLQGDTFPCHPDSNVRFFGHRIPCWDALIERTIEIAKVTPQLRYIGWDFVLDDKHRWILLEGNEPGGVEILQLPRRKGLYFDYKTALGYK